MAEFRAWAHCRQFFIGAIGLSGFHIGSADGVAVAEYGRVLMADMDDCMGGERLRPIIFFLNPPQRRLVLQVSDGSSLLQDVSLSGVEAIDVSREIRS